MQITILQLDGLLLEQVVLIVTPQQHPSIHQVQVIFSAGFVELTMTLEQDGCNAVSDSMGLTIVQEVIANAGNDLEVCQGESATVVSASVANFQ